MPSRSKSANLPPFEAEPGFHAGPHLEDLFSGYGGGLDKLRFPHPADQDEPGEAVFDLPGPQGWQAIDPRWLEHLLLADGELRALLDKTGRKQADYRGAVTPVQTRVEALLEEVVLPKIVEKLFAATPLVARYLVARLDYYRRHPEEAICPENT